MKNFRAIKMKSCATCKSCISFYSDFMEQYVLACEESMNSKQRLEISFMNEDQASLHVCDEHENKS